MTAQHSINLAKKGQVSFHETFLVLFIVILLLFVGLFLYYKYSLSSIQNAATTLKEEDATVLLASLAQLPELRCTAEVCLNTAHFLPFASLTQSQQAYYQQLFGYQTMTVEQLYPVPSAKQACTLQHYSQAAYPDNCNSWKLYDSRPSRFTGQYTVSTFVTLFYPEIDAYRLGRLSIIVYEGGGL